MTLKKYDLRDRLAQKAKMTKNLSLEMISLVFDIILEEVSQGNKVILPKIGTLKPVLHKSVAKGSFKKGENIILPPKLRMKLVSSSILKKKMEELLKLQQMESSSFFK